MIKKRLIASLVLVLIAFLVIAWIWCPSFYSPICDLLSELEILVKNGVRPILTLIVVIIFFLLVICALAPIRNSTRNNVDCCDEDADECEELSRPYPVDSNWNLISEFQYKSHLKLLRFKKRPSYISPKQHYIVAKDYTVYFNLDGEAKSITVPKGMLTDLASVPPIFRFYVGRVGRHLEASIFHDYLYMAWQFTGISPTKNMRRFADELMLAGMLASGIWCKAWVIYWTVRLFGCCAFFSKNTEPLVLSNDQLPECCYSNPSHGNDLKKRESDD